jgi:hypothetical protein
MSRWLRQLLPVLHPSSAHCADNSNGNNNGASSSDGDDDDYHKHTVATKTWSVGHVEQGRRAGKRCPAALAGACLLAWR